MPYTAITLPSSDDYNNFFYHTELNLVAPCPIRPSCDNHFVFLIHTVFLVSTTFEILA